MYYLYNLYITNSEGVSKSIYPKSPERVIEILREYETDRLKYEFKLVSGDCKFIYGYNNIVEYAKSQLTEKEIRVKPHSYYLVADRIGVTLNVHHCTKSAKEMLERLQNCMLPDKPNVDCALTMKNTLGDIIQTVTRIDQIVEVLQAYYNKYEFVDQEEPAPEEETTESKKKSKAKYVFTTKIDGDIRIGDKHFNSIETAREWYIATRTNPTLKITLVINEERAAIYHTTDYVIQTVLGITAASYDQVSLLKYYISTKLESIEPLVDVYDLDSIIGKLEETAKYLRSIKPE